MNRKTYLEGLAFGAGAFVLWGLLPLYWKAVQALSPYQIFAHRVVWSFLVVYVILSITKKRARFFAALRSKKELKAIIPAAVAISINWLLYIWAVNNNYVIETSLGYYMNPLILALFGRLFYGERLSRLEYIGFLFAGTGVVLKTIFYGAFPYIAVILAVCFALYGLFKKRSVLESTVSLEVETLVIGIPSILYLIYAEATGTGISGNLPMWYWGLIALSGIMTAVPLLLYSESAKRLPLTVLGFLQYIAPTLALFLGVFVFGEAFTWDALMCFALIWIGLILFTVSQYRQLKERRKTIG